MNENIIRCRCGHRVLGREVLRTEFYERRSFLSESIREYVYVKYRCKRCKRMGESFIPDSKWDWKVLEAQPNELSDVERDLFLDEEPISTQDIRDLHERLETVASLKELLSSAEKPDAATIPDAAEKNSSVATNSAANTSDKTSLSSTRSLRNNSEQRPGEQRLGEPRTGETRANEQPSNTPKPPAPPLANDDSSRKG